MKNIIVIIAATLPLAAPLGALGMEHSTMKMDHGAHGAQMGNLAHKEVVDGVKATFIIQPMAEAMKTMKMEMPKDMKETHHIHVEFKDVKTGKALTEGDVKVKLQSPDKTGLTKDLMGMQGHFGADINMAQKGKYGVMCKFLLKDGKVRSAKFWYTIK